MDSNYFRLGPFLIGPMMTMTTTSGEIIWVDAPRPADPDPGRYWEGKPRFGGL